MKRLILLILSFVSLRIAVSQSIIVNPDGTHSTIFHNGNTSTIVNPNGTHSPVFHNGNISTVVNPNGTHSTIFHNGNTSTIVNPNGTTSTIFHNGNISTVVNSNGTQSTIFHNGNNPLQKTNQNNANASAEPTDSAKLNRSDSLSISDAGKQLKSSKRKAKRGKEPKRE